MMSAVRFLGVLRMSDGELAGFACKAGAVSRLEEWGQETGRVFLSRADIASLSEDGSSYLLISSPEELLGLHEASKAIVSKGVWIGRGTLKAIAAGACIGASSGLSVAATFVLMTYEAPTDVVSLITRALSLFA